MALWVPMALPLDMESPDIALPDIALPDIALLDMEFPCASA